MHISITIFLLIAIAIGCLWVYKRVYKKIWPQMGGKPQGKLLKQLQKSPQFSKKKKCFVNPRQKEMDRYVKEIKLFKVLKEFFRKNSHRVPNKKLPSQPVDTKKFLQTKNGDASIVWFGHSSFMLRFCNKTLLFDPVFEPSLAWPKFLTRRFQPPPAQLNHLPKPDYVVLTHDHYDHLNWGAITYLQKYTNATFIMPLGVSCHLLRWGTPKSRILEADWGESIALNGITLRCTPARHFSGRVIMSHNRTLWCSWIIEDTTKEAAKETTKESTKKSAKEKTLKYKKNDRIRKIFHSGDSGYDNHFKSIAQKHGPIDFAIMENGQYHDMWRPVHMHPEEMIAALGDIGCPHAMPIHWGMFSLAPHDWNEPMLRASKAAQEKNIKLYTPKLGQLLQIVKNNPTKKIGSKNNSKQNQLIANLNAPIKTHSTEKTHSNKKTHSKKNEQLGNSPVHQWWNV